MSRKQHFFLKSAEGVADADLVLLVTTRPTTGNTLAWAVACERDQWGRAIAGKFFLEDDSCLCHPYMVLNSGIGIHNGNGIGVTYQTRVTL